MLYLIGAAPPHVTHLLRIVLQPQRLVTAGQRLARGVEVAGDEDDLRRNQRLVGWRALRKVVLLSELIEILTQGRDAACAAGRKQDKMP